MKKTFTLVCLVLLIGCKTEEDVSPASGTFVRYFGSGNNHVAVLADQDPSNRLLLLANYDETLDGFPRRKIKFIRTDNDGNLEGQNSYPAYQADNTLEESYEASSFISVTEGANPGYVIVGDRINAQTTDLLLLRVKFDRENGQDLPLQDHLIVEPADLGLDPANEVSLHGRAVIWTSDLDETGQSIQCYLVLGAIEDEIDGNDDMFVMQVKQDLTIGWKRTYGSFESTLINKLYKTSDDKLSWGVAVESGDQNDVQFVKAGKNDQSPLFGGALGAPDENEEPTDFCSIIGGWAVTGSNGEDEGQDILLMKVSNSFDLVFKQTYHLEDGQEDVGNSVCQAADGGIIILATSTTATTQEDLWLFKVNSINGEQEVGWGMNYGGTDVEQGASVRLLSDGSYLVFGTSSFSRVQKLMLMKVNQRGQL